MYALSSFNVALRAVFSIILLVLSIGPAWGGTPTPCRTNGPFSLQNLTPGTHSYIQNQPGGTNGSFLVSSPSVQINGNCNTGMTPVFGSTGNSTINVSINIGSITSMGSAVDMTTFNAIAGGFFFSPNPFNLILGGTGQSPVLPTQSVNFSFTNNPIVPPGSYDILIRTTSGNGVGAGTAAFVLTVTEPPPVAVDTQAPLVEIQSPTSAQEIILNGTLNVSFTANDPYEAGAGTGVTSVSARVESAGGTVNEDLTPDLSINPALPISAGITVTSIAEAIMTAVGAYSLTAEATDGANHTGAASVNFVVKANVIALPPISVPGRQFKAGSTVPVKWTLTDANGAFLPPFPSIQAWIGILPSYTPVFAGDGSSNIRWELDEAGNATQYITNFPIPSSPTSGTYTVQIYVDGVDGVPAYQGSFTFAAASKGGK
jgi:hypothetical protein